MDVGAGIAYGSLLGLLSLCKDAEDYHMLCRLPLGIEKPDVALKGAVYFREAGNSCERYKLGYYKKENAQYFETPIYYCIEIC